MTQTPPDSALLAASIDYLETQLLPALEGEHRFKTRLVVNALKTLARGRPSPEPAATQEADGPAEQLALKIRNHELALNDIGTVMLRLSGPLLVDAYAQNRATGSFILIDEATNNTVAAGMIQFGLRRATEVAILNAKDVPSGEIQRLTIRHAVGGTP